MLYCGYFRNVDTSIDPKGQLYKVEIFTDGKLYTYHPYIHSLLHSPVMIPDAGTQIQLSGNPFVVEYTADNDNKYKAYKASTASVGLILNQYNFISDGKCNILVRLLKYKNEVVDRSINFYNTETNEVLHKTRIYATIGQQSRLVYNDFTEESIDNFCYNVEWVGYATPNIYNQPYNRIIEECVLECQDVLSCLEYYDYNPNSAGSSTFLQSITSSLRLLPNNPIKNVYMTNTIRQSVVYRENQDIIKQLSTINDNWIDEDGERTNCLDVISNLMQYLGVTIIQWKDSIYITTPDAIANDLKYYYKETVPTTISNIIRHTGNNTFFEVGDNYEISENELGASSTTLSTTSSYKKASITTDEYYEGNLAPDISDNKALLEQFRWDEVKDYSAAYDVDRNILSHDYPYNYDIENKHAKYAGSYFHYDTSNGNGSTIQHYYYPRDTKSGIWGVQNYNTTSEPTSINDIFNKVGCSIVDFNAAEISNDNAMADMLENYSGKRAFLFHNTFPQVSASVFGMCVCPLLLDVSKVTNSAYAQRVLKITTKPCFIKAKQSLQINGNIIFYQNITLPLENGWQFDTLKAYKLYMFIWVRISVYCAKTNQTYYLVNDGSVTGKYTWSTSSSWCKLWYDNFNGYDEDGDTWATNDYAFENLFQFNKNTRGAEGTCIELPEAFDTGEYRSFTIDIARPWGCARETKITDTVHFYPAQYSVLTNFSINVIDNNETQFRYESEDNNEFKADITDKAVDNFKASNLLISSNYYKNTSKSSVIGLNSDSLVTNYGTGAGLLPEANYIYNIIKSYATSKLRLQITLPKEITPFTNVKWTTQFPNKKFVVDKLSIDYAYNDYTVDLLENRLDNITPEIYTDKKTKNFRRNGDNLYNPLPRKDQKKLIDPYEYPNEHSAAIIVSYDDQVLLNTDSHNTLLRNTWFEPNFVNNELLYEVPYYMNTDTQNASATINSNGELILTYNYQEL